MNRKTLASGFKLLSFLVLDGGEVVIPVASPFALEVGTVVGGGIALALTAIFLLELLYEGNHRRLLLCC